ncbi:MAG: adenylate/guanylate cyclase domain-containing protein [Syntrophales bacterium]|nr:adenylate/guanylate cyclase domain-containing protein [Syntrophales bacterium]
MYAVLRFISLKTWLKGKLGQLTKVSPTKITVLIIIIAIIAFFIDPPFMRFMELKSLDLRLVSRGRLPTTDVVVIAAIDEKSLGEIGRWPWSRKVIAKLVEKLKSDGAKAIAFDIVFSEPEENPSMKVLQGLSEELGGLDYALKDRLYKVIKAKRDDLSPDKVLAKAIERTGNVTLGYFFYTTAREVAHLKPEEIDMARELISNSRYPMVQSKGQVDERNLIHAYAAVANIKELSEVAVNSGYFNAYPDSDGVIRWSPLVVKFGDGYYYSLAMAALLQFAGMPIAGVRLAEFGVESIIVENISIPVDESGRILINYRGPAKTFPHYSITDILHNRLPPDTLRDKIVIVGATATGIYDLRVTPYSSVYPGVEIHANVIDNILVGDFLKRTNFTIFLDMCAIIVLGMIVGLTIPRLKAVLSVIVTLSFLITFIFVNTLLLAKYRIWLNMVYPVATIIVIYTFITVYRYVTEEMEKKRIRSAFQYYLTPAVINEILQDPSKLKLGGDKKELTVMFSDVRGFTTISESLSPEDLVSLLNEYLSEMTRIVFKYDGLLDKYIGDAIMAVFGAPIDQHDHALRACKTALDMMEKLKALQDKWEQEGRPRLDIGIGINSGDMVVGNMGSDIRFDYTVMGDNVNLASRLEGINKEYGTHIVISEYTYERVKDHMFCRELDAVRVKGKKMPVKIYELLCERENKDAHEKYVKVFEEALDAYRSCQWDRAIALFEKVIQIKGEDPPSEVYIKRCLDLKENPPDQPWDGVYTMTKK